jgi:RimJ/RimL family protein N-acetyltransferase
MTLETERLILREFQETDFEAVHEYGSDPEVVRYLEWGPNTEHDTRNYLQSQIAQQDQQARRVYGLALVLKTSGGLIGACGIHIARPEHKEAFIGYVLNKNYWNQGYITEAARRVVQFGFENLGLHRIYATCDPANVASARVMEKVGMKREGQLREHKLAKGRWRDSLLYAILEQEYRKMMR